MELFVYRDFKLGFEPEALTLEPFKKLWERDRTKSKKKAFSDFAFVYFMADYKSDFADLLDEDLRKEEVGKAVYGIEDYKYKEDKAIEKAIDFYKERQQTVSSRLLEDSRTAIAKISSFLGAINTKEMKTTDVAKITSMVGAIDKMLETMTNLEARVKKEIESKTGIKGGREKTVFEDGI